MKPKKIDYDILCSTPLRIPPKMLKMLANTVEFFYRTVIYPLLDEKPFAPMYSDIYRPGTSPSLILSLMSLMSERHISHEEAVEALHFDQRFQLATNTLGMESSQIPGCSKMFARFESEADEYAKTNKVPNPIDLNYENITVACCALTGMDLSLVRSDSMQVSGNFRIQSREELVYTAVSKAVEYLFSYGTDAQKEAIQKSNSLKKYTDVLFTLNNFTYHWAETPEAKREMLCKDAAELLPLLSPKDKEEEELKACVRVIDEQTREENGSRIFIPKGDEALKTGSLVQSLLDTDATCRQKNHKYFWGYVLNAIEAVNGLTHLPILFCLYPNKKSDSSMEEELLAMLPSLTEKVDSFYAKYPALVKGDAKACQSVVQSVMESLQQDFIKEGTALYEMVRKGGTDEDIKAQQKKTLAVLDSFYSRLASKEPLPPKTKQDAESDEGSIKPDAPADAEGGTPSAASQGGAVQSDNPATLPEVDGKNNSPLQEEAVGKASTKQGETDNSGAASQAAQLNPTFRRTMTDWVNYGEAPVDWTSSEFANKADDFRRNFYLRKIAESPENSFEIPKGKKICVSDAAYSAAEEAAGAAGYVLLTTNSLGKKANPIIALFQKEGDEYTKCPRGKPVVKQSVHKDGSVCIWMNDCDCSKCPCAADCNAKSQKRSGLATIRLDINAIPALVSEAVTATDEYQELGDIRNGTETLMSYYRNYYHCDEWPIGLICKQRLAKLMNTTTCIKNTWLFFRGKTRVHPNRLLGTKTD